MENLRVFIAAVPPGNIIKSLIRSVSGYKKETWGKAVRWVKPENLHITLKFIGEVEKNKLCDIVSAVEEASYNVNSFTAEISGLMMFPRASRPKIISAEIKENIRLMTLADNLDQSLSTIGLPKEKRKFKGHVTLGRFKRSFTNLEKINDRIIRNSFVVKDIFIFQSILRPGGPEYKIEHQVNLR